MGELKERMKGDLALRCYSKNTEEEYLRYAQRYAGHFMKSPAKMGEAQVREYLLHVKRDEKAGPATLKGNVAALKFLQNGEKIENRGSGKSTRRTSLFSTKNRIDSAFFRRTRQP